MLSLKGMESHEHANDPSDCDAADPDSNLSVSSALPLRSLRVASQTFEKRLQLSNHT